MIEKLKEFFYRLERRRLILETRELRRMARRYKESLRKEDLNESDAGLVERLQEDYRSVMVGLRGFQKMDVRDLARTFNEYRGVFKYVLERTPTKLLKDEGER